MRLWDLILLDGDIALFRAALGVLRHYAPLLLSPGLDDDELAALVSRLPAPRGGAEADALVASVHAASVPAEQVAHMVDGLPEY